MDFYSIPIFIISWNRTETLRLCIERYQKDGYRNIIILDNASTDKKHLSYLKSLPYKVYYFEKNYGTRVLYECGLFESIIQNEYYVLTDPDILPIEDCPGNYLEEFYNLLQKHPEKQKIGFSLKIDNLPEDYPFKYEIMRYESIYYDKKIQYKFPIYDAPIDTTFALYRPGGAKDFYEAFRTGYPYTAYHLGWYPNQFGQKEYFINKNNQNASAMSTRAMQIYRVMTIAHLANLQSENFYYLIKRIYTKDFVKKHVTWKDVAKTIFFVSTRKFASALQRTNRRF